jgi:hypothetical protein
MIHKWSVDYGRYSLSWLLDVEDRDQDAINGFNAMAITQTFFDTFGHFFF